MSNFVYLFDTSLRDGAQTSGVDFTLADKQAIASALDNMGFDYIEGGWPGANPTDDQFFAADPKFTSAKFTAFGMTRRPGRSVQNDPGLALLLQSQASVITLVGKSWDFHVNTALEIALEENLAMISDSIAHLVANGREAIFDAEHFFDGYKANPQYALACIEAAHQAGARWVVLCDTNGGTLPHEVYDIVKAVCQKIAGDHVGIHAHNDTENAVANSLAAVEAGARHVQGTINGLGERCGNANIISVAASLALKTDYEISLPSDKISQLTKLSRLLDERLNRTPNRHLPYVGASAFAHKGGLHVSAVLKDPKTYEHIPPESVGNSRQIVVSDQAGRSNLLARLKDLNLSLDDKQIDQLLAHIKRRESQGYSYDGAEASFELIARKVAGQIGDKFGLTRFRVIDEHRINALGETVNESEATIWLDIDGQEHLHVAMGKGPVHAIGEALKQGLQRFYPELNDFRLVDFKVRILPPAKDATGTEAITRVTIESAAGQSSARWLTIGVSENIISASVEALLDAINYQLFVAKPAA